MAKQSRKTQKLQTGSKDFTVVAFAETIEQAKDYESLLKANEIPAMIKEQAEESTERTNFVIVVPEDYIDEALVIIESQDAYEDFYDLTAENDDFDTFDDDLFDDVF
ncbi:hypothetical protein ACFL3G_05305 [Planctomycetota bacterium]